MDNELSSLDQAVYEALALASSKSQPIFWIDCEADKWTLIAQLEVKAKEDATRRLREAGGSIG